MIKSKSEKSILIEQNDNASYVELKYSKWLTHTVIISIPSLHICSYTLSLFVIHQYAYYAFMKEKYPNETIETETLPECIVNTSTVEYEHQIEIQKIAAEWNIICNLCYLVPSIFMDINLATYSDAYGRKLFLIIPLAGTLLKNVCVSLGIYFEINIRLLLIFDMIEASTGSFIACDSIASCLIADTTEPGKSRSFIIGLLAAGIGIGGFVATFISGYLISSTDGYFYPEVIAGGCVGIGLLLALTMVQETLPKSKRRKRVSIWQNMTRVTECYRTDFSPNEKPWVFRMLICLFALSSISNLTRTNVDTLYQLNSPFCWNSVKIGVYSSIRFCFWTIGGLIIIKVFHIFTGDEVIALVGCLTSVVSLTIQGLANDNNMLYISAAASIGCIVTMPMVRGIMSRMTPTEKQGSVFAGIAAVEVLSALAGGIVINAVYNATVDIYKGLTFLVWTIFGGTGIILCIILIIGKNVKKEKQDIADKREITIKVEFRTEKNDKPNEGDHTTIKRSR